MDSEGLSRLLASLCMQRLRDTLGAGTTDAGSRPAPMSLEHPKVLDLTIHLSGPYRAIVLANSS